MKTILFACLLGLASAAPQDPSLYRGAYGANPYYNQNPYYNRGAYNNPIYRNNPAYYNQGQYNPNNPINPYYRNPGPFVPILGQTNEINPDGSYEYSYATGDGQQAEARGFLRNIGSPEGPAEVAQGSYSYTSPEGTPIQVNWIADEFGFRAQGPHIPVSIQRAAGYSAAVAAGQGPAPFFNSPYGRYGLNGGPIPAPLSVPAAVTVRP